MQLDDVIGNAVDQDKGRWLDIADPWTGEPAGMRFLIAGPDSETQRRARIAMMDELAEMSDPAGRVTAEQRETARVNCLAKAVLNWEIQEAGQHIPFRHTHVVRVLRAAAWLQAQVDSFAGDRHAFRPEGT